MEPNNFFETRTDLTALNDAVNTIRAEVAKVIVGQQTISPTLSAFITGFYVLLVPLFSAILLSRLPSWRILLCALVALIGLFLLNHVGIRWPSLVRKALLLPCSS